MKQNQPVTHVSSFLVRVCSYDNSGIELSGMWYCSNHRSGFIFHNFLYYGGSKSHKTSTRDFMFYQQQFEKTNKTNVESVKLEKTFDFEIGFEE